MKVKMSLSIQVKAAFLLFVFSLSTLVGFACAIGIDMNFNTSHHAEEKATVHIHKDGKKHVHKKAGAHQPVKKHDSKKDDCCNDEVIKFQNLDKSLSQNAKPAIDVFGSLTLPANLFGITILRSFQRTAYKYIVRNFHPPPTDIRIAIQRFQI